MLTEPASQGTDAIDDRLQLAAEFMGSAPGQMGSITALSKRFGMEPAYFSRSFNEWYGQTPTAFWNRARIDRAANLLRETRLSLSEIAETLGYCDVYHFSKQFKKIQARPSGVWRSDPSGEPQ